MARRLRVEYPRAVYHVTAVGNARMPIFEDKADGVSCLQIAGEAFERFNWRFHAFCFMGKHYHLLLETMAEEANHKPR